MKRVSSVLLLLTLPLVLPPISLGRSIPRPGAPRITFHKLVCPKSVKQGEVFRLNAFLSTAQNLWEEKKVFLHLVNAADAADPSKMALNADFWPKTPTTTWAIGEIVEMGPIGMMAP